MKAYSVYIIATVCLLLLCTSCNERDTTLTETSVRDWIPGAAFGSGTLYYIERVGQLDTLFNDPALPDIASGDTLLFAGGTTFDCTNKKYHKDNITIYLFGETTGGIPLVKRDGAPATPNELFRFRDTPSIGVNTVEIKDLDFEATANDNSSVFITVSNLLTFNMTNVEFDRDDQGLTLTATNLTIDGCAFVAEAAGCKIVATENNFDHTVKNSSFSNTAANGGQAGLVANYSQKGGTLEIDTNTFTLSTSGERRYLQLIPTSSVARTIDLRLLDNQFNDSKLLIDDTPGAANITLDIYYDGDSTEIAVCIEDTYIEGDDIEIAWEGVEWFKEDSLFGYKDFTNLTDKARCVVNDTAYVKFKVDPVGDYDDYNNPVYETAVVVYGDDDCETTTEAWLNSQGLYNAMFYVGDITDSDFYWKGKVTFCQKTVQSTCIKWTTRPCRGGIPSWFEDQPGK